VLDRAGSSDGVSQQEDNLQALQARSYLRIGYNRAMDRYTARGGQPHYATWKAFKRNVSCTTARYSPSYGNWCMFAEAEERVLEQAQKPIRMASSCMTHMVVASVGSGIQEKILLNAVSPHKAAAWGLAGLGGCMAGKLFDSIWPF
jgi:hypothetical protein